MNVKKIQSDEAESLCRAITKDLPEYFGLLECNEHYAQGVRDKINFTVETEQECVGLLSLDFQYPKNANIYWMGIFKNHQSKGYGEQLIHAAIADAKQYGAVMMTVETLSPSEADENYLKTYRFYEKMGFVPLFNLKPEGYVWNMVYMGRVL